VHFHLVQSKKLPELYAPHGLDFLWDVVVCFFSLGCFFMDIENFTLPAENRKKNPWVSIPCVFWVSGNGYDTGEARGERKWSRVGLGNAWRRRHRTPAGSRGNRDPGGGWRERKDGRGRWGLVCFGHQGEAVIVISGCTCSGEWRG
jgi:hypothetical protein